MGYSLSKYTVITRLHVLLKLCGNNVTKRVLIILYNFVVKNVESYAK